MTCGHAHTRAFGTRKLFATCYIYKIILLSYLGNCSGILHRIPYVKMLYITNKNRGNAYSHTTNLISRLYTIKTKRCFYLFITIDYLCKSYCSNILTYHSIKTLSLFCDSITSIFMKICTV